VLQPPQKGSSSKSGTLGIGNAGVGNFSQPDWCRIENQFCHARTHAISHPGLLVRPLHCLMHASWLFFPMVTYLFFLLPGLRRNPWRAAQRRNRLPVLKGHETGKRGKMRTA
jgi:hypothetical protein